MPWRICIWSEQNEAHLAEHDVTPDEFEHVLNNRAETVYSRSSGLPAAVGFVGGRRLFCVYREIDAVYVEPVTAFEIDF